MKVHEKSSGLLLKSLLELRDRLNKQQAVIDDLERDLLAEKDGGRTRCFEEALKTLHDDLSLLFQQQEAQLVEFGAVEAMELLSTYLYEVVVNAKLARKEAIDSQLFGDIKKILMEMPDQLKIKIVNSVLESAKSKGLVSDPPRPSGEDSTKP